MMHGTTFSYRQIIFALWLLWAAYWMISAAGNKTTRRRESRASRWAYTITLLVGVTLIAWPRLELGILSRPLLPDAPWRFQTALALLLAGLLFTVWARVHLGRNWSGTVTLKEGHELVRTGPYALVRHPIYTGLIIALLGSAIACGEPRALLGLALVVLSFVHKLRIEGRFMQEVFPGQYERYRATVPALIPFAPAGAG
jgi:protein-S-isoprenylcysteine O-methyltransferase Ste14